MDFCPPLPPHLLKQRQEQQRIEEEEEKTKETTGGEIGVQLPPHILESRKRKVASQEEDKEGQKDETPVAEESPQPPVKRRVMGPSLDDLVRESVVDSEDQADNDEPPPVVGPLLASDPRARKPEPARPSYIVTASYALDGQDRRADPTAKRDDRRKKLETGTKPKPTTVDSATSSLMDKYNQAHRPQSLVEKHIKEVKSRKASEPKKDVDEWRPWDREKDLNFRPMSAQVVNSVLKKAKELDSRFSHQSGGRYL